MDKVTASHQPLSLFISYVLKDESYLCELEIHLKALVRQKLIASWSRKNLMPGTEAQTETIQKLKTSDIILIMISPDLIGSDTFWEVEMPIALERHHQLDSVVIPILLRSVYWQETPIAQLQILPRNKIPVQTWDDPDVAYACIVAEIREVVGEIYQKRVDGFKYQSFLTEKLEGKYLINDHLRKELQEFSNALLLSDQEICCIESSLLSINRERAVLKVKNLNIYGKFYKENRIKEDSIATLRPIFDSKLTDLSLDASDPDILKLERSIENELSPRSVISHPSIYLGNFMGILFKFRTALIVVGGSLSVILLLPLIFYTYNEFDSREKSEVLPAYHETHDSLMDPKDFFMLYVYRLDHGLYEEAFQMLSSYYIQKIYLAKGFSREEAFEDFKSFWDRCDLAYQNLSQDNTLSGNEAIIYYQSRRFCNDDSQVGRNNDLKSKKMTLTLNERNNWEIKDVVDN
jgi:hypothetical protein